MNKNLLQKYQVIGRCEKPQQYSLEDIIKLIEGTPYCIDFNLDFSKIMVNRKVLADYTVLELINALGSLQQHQEVSMCKDISYKWDSGINMILSDPKKMKKAIKRAEKENEDSIHGTDKEIKKYRKQAKKQEKKRQKERQDFNSFLYSLGVDDYE